VNASGVSFGGFYGAKLGRSFYTRRFCAKAASLLAQAEEAVRDDPPSLARVRRVRQVILTGLLEAWDWTDPSLSKADRAAYAGYLADYLKMKADMETPEEEIEEFLRSTAHLRVGKPWPQDPLIQRFLADPAGTLEQELPAVRASFQQEIPGGWQLPLEAFRGGTGPVFYRWMCPGKMMKGIYGRTSDLHTMRAQLVLSPPPAGAGELVVEGQNCDREGPATRIRIRLNRTVLFEGPNRFAVRGWSTETFPIPAGALRQGENTLTLENLEREARRWFLVSDVKVIRE
jgi:hypothetical protein